MPITTFNGQAIVFNNGVTDVQVDGVSVVDENKVAHLDSATGGVSKEYVDSECAKKQDKLTAGANITITSEGVISASGGGGSSMDVVISKGFNNVSFTVPDDYDGSPIAEVVTALQDIGIYDADMSKLPNWATRTVTIWDTSDWTIKKVEIEAGGFNDMGKYSYYISGYTTDPYANYSINTNGKVDFPAGSYMLVADAVPYIKSSTKVETLPLPSYCDQDGYICIGATFGHTVGGRA